MVIYVSSCNSELVRTESPALTQDPPIQFSYYMVMEVKELTP